jgi:antibiotic biosynthesis monooxygenase (ABM) superfamily enzyme
MISRHWKGITKAGLADRYIDHLRQETFPALSAIPGYRSASILRRDVRDGTEFQVVTLWDSMDAIHAFAGETADVAVVPPVVQEMMADYDRRVVHYEVAGTHTGG